MHQKQLHMDNDTNLNRRLLDTLQMLRNFDSIYTFGIEMLKLLYQHQLKWSLLQHRQMRHELMMFALLHQMTKLHNSDELPRDQ